MNSINLFAPRNSRAILGKLPGYIISYFIWSLFTTLVNERNDNRGFPTHSVTDSPLNASGFICISQISLKSVRLARAIEEALAGFRRNINTTVLFHLEENFNIKEKEIPQKLAEFQSALEQVFGIGARNLEILFMKSLHSKIEILCKWPTWCKWVIPEVTFQEYVCLMKQKYEEIGGARVVRQELGDLT